MRANTVHLHTCLRPVRGLMRSLPTLQAVASVRWAAGVVGDAAFTRAAGGVCAGRAVLAANEDAATNAIIRAYAATRAFCPCTEEA
jgi:hypothetical protein